MNEPRQSPWEPEGNALETKSDPHTFTEREARMNEPRQSPWETEGEALETNSAKGA